MKKLLLWLIIFVCVFYSIEVNAQKTINPVISTAGVPGSCISGRVYTNSLTGFVYVYKSGVGCFLVGGSIDGSGSANRIAYWSDADTLTSNAGFTFDGTNLTSPIHRGGDGAANAPTFSFTNATGTGTYLAGTNILGFTTNGTLRWTINASGHLLANTDNSFDIGATGATRPRTGYFGTSVIAPTFTFSTSILAASDGGATIGAVGASRPNLYAYAISSGSASNAAGEFRWGTTTGMTRILSGNIQIGSGVHFGFAGGDPTGVATDVGLVRSAAGKIRVSNGSSGYGTISGAAAFAYRTTVQSIPHATWTSIQFDNELDDTNTFHDNVTNNSRITINATTAGRIILKCTVGITANSTGGRVIRIYKNGTTIVGGPITYETVTNGDPTTMLLVVDIPDAANADYYECQVFQSNSGTGSLNTESTRGTMNFSVISY